MSHADLHSVVENGFSRLDLPASSTSIAGLHVIGIHTARSQVCPFCATSHLFPDVGKFVALENIRRSLKPGGQFILRDVVYSISPGGATDEFERFVGSLPEVTRPAVIQHIAKEYSTLDRIMEGLLKRAGFEILSAQRVRESFIRYHCRKATRSESKR